MWLFKNIEFTSEDIKNNYGFCYVITNLITNKKYLGKKLFWAKRTLPPLKGKKRKRHKVVESNWKKYQSSSKYLKEDIEKLGADKFKFEIISLHPNKTETNYQELKLLILNNVLEVVNEEGKRLFYNENIERVFYHSVDQNSQRLINTDRILG